MAFRIDLTGAVYGRLTVIAHVPPKYQWRCKCECGKEVIVSSNAMRTGKTKSCGCLQQQRAGEANTARAKHGHTRHKKSEPVKTTPTYRTWKCMLDRCRCAKMPNYHLYGGRGITVCEQWQGKGGFAQFLTDVGERPEGKTIDRIDTNGNYEPGNVKWSTPKEQAATRRKRRPATASPVI